MRALEGFRQALGHGVGFAGFHGHGLHALVLLDEFALTCFGPCLPKLFLHFFLHA
tara:strand:- start:271 stop:435 length:165 start_codon:yes stop_codon:yes gene_type:complete